MGHNIARKQNLTTEQNSCNTVCSKHTIVHALHKGDNHNYDDDNNNNNNNNKPDIMIRDNEKRTCMSQETEM